MTWDLVIRGGVVVDGTGLSRRRADVAVKDGRIAVTGHVPDAHDTHRMIDAEDRLSGDLGVDGVVGLGDHLIEAELLDLRASDRRHRRDGQRRQDEGLFSHGSEDPSWC